MATDFFFLSPLTFHLSECASISSDTWGRDTLQGNVAVKDQRFKASQHLVIKRQISKPLGFLQFMRMQLFVVCILNNLG